jgi:drug/metabolite transporter (DMT)-like permease
MSITEISFLYLAFEAFTTVLWLVIVFGATRGVRGTWRETRILQPVVMGVMIYVTYGIVLVSMAFAADVSYIVAFRQVSLPIGVVLGLVLLKERGGWLRLGSTVVMVAGLMLVATG